MLQEVDLDLDINTHEHMLFVKKTGPGPHDAVLCCLSCDKELMSLSFVGDVDGE